MIIGKLLCKLGFHKKYEKKVWWEECYHYRLIGCSRCPRFKLEVSIAIPPEVREKTKRIVEEIIKGSKQ